LGKSGNILPNAQRKKRRVVCNQQRNVGMVARHGKTEAINEEI